MDGLDWTGLVLDRIGWIELDWVDRIGWIGLDWTELD